MSEPSDEFKSIVGRSLITATIVAIVTSITTRMSVTDALGEKLIELDQRVSQVESRYVELNQFQPTKEQAIENKNRINDNVKQLQEHEITLNLMK